MTGVAQVGCTHCQSLVICCCLVPDVPPSAVLSWQWCHKQGRYQLWRLHAPTAGKALVQIHGPLIEGSMLLQEQLQVLQQQHERFQRDIGAIIEQKNAQLQQLQDENLRLSRHSAEVCLAALQLPHSNLAAQCRGKLGYVALHLVVHVSTRVVMATFTAGFRQFVKVQASGAMLLCFSLHSSAVCRSRSLRWPCCASSAATMPRSGQP